MNELFVEKKKGKKKGTIVFIHGNSSSSRVFEKTMDLERLPYTLIRFDLPGHGRSYRSENEEGYKFASYKKALFKVLEGHDDILLVGNSMGGHLVLEVAREIETLKGLVIFGTPPLKKPLNPSEAFLPNPVLQYYFTENVTDAQLDEAMNEAVQNRAVTPILREDFRNCDPRVRGVLGKELAEGSVFLDEAAIFRELHCPRYIIHGRQDPTSKLGYLEELCAKSDGTAEIIMIENCGHYASLELPGFFTEKLAYVASQTLGQHEFIKS